uniref:Putative histone-fold protein chrac subunit n=1 Tax=Corethrella appendiculata TaxID=1370023 RepID=U5EHH9_9DIPT
MDEDKDKSLKKSNTIYSLPLTRVKQVMKTSPEIEKINGESLFLVCRAAELFISFITKKSYISGSRNFDYKHMANYVEKTDMLEFLLQILPKKITVHEFKKKMAEKNDSDDDDTSSEEDESSEASEAESSDDSAIQVDSDSDEKENSKNQNNKSFKHKTGDSP